MPVNATQRTILSDLVKGVMSFEEDTKTNFNTVSVDVKGSGAVGCIGIPVKWDGANSAFYVFAAPADWAATTAYAVGDVVKPTTRDGNEYVCTVAGTSGGAEPTWVTTEGGETVDNTATFTARKAYSQDLSSPLPNKASVALLVGDEFGAGFNKADVTLSATAITMTALYRGDATIVNDGITWGSVAAADQAEFLAALEDQRITTIDSATSVTPSYAGV